jgi:hypothetical protein
MGAPTPAYVMTIYELGRPNTREIQVFSWVERYWILV